MKKLFIFIISMIVFSKVNGQKIQEISAMDIDEAIPKFEKISTFKELKTVKLLGIGDVGMFAKEPKKLNLSFSAYLISKMKFRNIVLLSDDWLIRPLNTYLTSSLSVDTAELDTLIKSVFDADHQFRNREFKTFLTWLKKYNAGHPQDMVNIFGVAPVTTIAPSYFLSTYIYPVDVSYGQKLSAKWSDNITSDSAAYSDVKIWIDSHKNQPISKQHRDLISSCAEDLLHNKSVLKRDSINQKFSQKDLDNRTRFIGDQILNKLNKKTIFFGLNKEVVKANLESIIVINNLQYLSIGNYLNNALAENYRVYVTDFAESATLPVADFATQKMNLETAVGSEQAKALYAKNDYFEVMANANLLKGYKPAFLSPFKDKDSKIIVEKDQYVFDGLFMLSVLSEIDFTY